MITDPVSDIGQAIRRVLYINDIVLLTKDGKVQRGKVYSFEYEFGGKICIILDEYQTQESWLGGGYHQWEKISDISLVTSNRHRLAQFNRIRDQVSILDI